MHGNGGSILESSGAGDPCSCCGKKDRTGACEGVQRRSYFPTSYNIDIMRMNAVERQIEVGRSFGTDAWFMGIMRGGGGMCGIADVGAYSCRLTSQFGCQGMVEPCLGEEVEVAREFGFAVWLEYQRHVTVRVDVGCWCV